MAEDNIGWTVKKGSTSIGTIKAVKAPVLHKDVIETTNHASAGKERIPSPLQDVQAFTVTLDLIEADFSTLKTDWAAGTISTYNVVAPDAGAIAQAFSAFITDLAIGQSDANSVDRLTVDVTFQPTGTVTVT